MNVDINIDLTECTMDFNGVCRKGVQICFTDVNGIKIHEEYVAEDELRLEYTRLEVLFRFSQDYLIYLVNQIQAINRLDVLKDVLIVSAYLEQMVTQYLQLEDNETVNHKTENKETIFLA